MHLLSKYLPACLSNIVVEYLDDSYTSQNPKMMYYKSNNVFKLNLNYRLHMFSTLNVGVINVFVSKLQQKLLIINSSKNIIRLFTKGNVKNYEIMKPHEVKSLIR
jgi:hypothetical protein